MKPGTIPHFIPDHKPHHSPGNGAISLGGRNELKKEWTTPQGSYYTLYKDMLQQPHLLVAGATGSGKSVVIFQPTLPMRGETANMHATVFWSLCRFSKGDSKGNEGNHVLDTFGNVKGRIGHFFASVLVRTARGRDGGLGFARVRSSVRRRGRS